MLQKIKVKHCYKFVFKYLTIPDGKIVLLKEPYVSKKNNSGTINESETIVGYVNSGESFFVIKENILGYLILTENGNVGFVYNEMLNFCNFTEIT